MDKAESIGVASIKSGIAEADRTAWNNTIEGYISSLEQIKTSDEAALVLDRQALALANAKYATVKSIAIASGNLSKSVMESLKKGKSDDSIDNVVDSLSAPYRVEYSEYVIYRNYVSRATYNLNVLTARIDRCAKDIETLNSLKF